MIQSPGYNTYNGGAQANWSQMPGYQNGQAFQTPPPARTSTLAPQRSFIQGRIVGTGNDIQLNEIPTDGSISIFPLADRSKIIIKEMTASGTIAESVYVLEQPQTTAIEDQNGPILTDIMERLKNIERMVKRPPRYHKKSTDKKEDDNA